MRARPARSSHRVRFYNPQTFAVEHLEYIEYIPDYPVAGVPRHVVGHALAAGGVPGYVFVVGSATIPDWLPSI